MLVFFRDRVSICSISSKSARYLTTQIQVHNSNTSFNLRRIYGEKICIQSHAPLLFRPADAGAGYRFPKATTLCPFFRQCRMEKKLSLPPEMSAMTLSDSAMCSSTSRRRKFSRPPLGHSGIYIIGLFGRKRTVGQFLGAVGSEGI